MKMYTKSSSAEQNLKWAHIWYRQFALFHRRAGQPNWDFCAEEVIQFLRSKRDADVPAWKRMKIIAGLIQYREQVQQRSVDDLRALRNKMVEIVQIERARDGGYDTIEEAVGKINPREPDAIQEFRRALRKDGMALQTRASRYRPCLVLRKWTAC